MEDAYSRGDAYIYHEYRHLGEHIHVDIGTPVCI